MHYISLSNHSEAIISLSRVALSTMEARRVRWPKITWRCVAESSRYRQPNNELTRQSCRTRQVDRKFRKICHWKVADKLWSWCCIVAWIFLQKFILTCSCEGPHTAVKLILIHGPLTTDAARTIPIFEWTRETPKNMENDTKPRKIWKIILSSEKYGK
jgi:hypothetical protein